MAQSFSSPIVAAAHKRDTAGEFARLLAALREGLSFEHIQRAADAMGTTCPAVEAIFGQAIHWKEDTQR